MRKSRTRLKKLIKDIRSKGTERNVLKMGISVKQNQLFKPKYSLHISETVFRIVVLISIDTCITVVLQIYTLKLRDSYLIMLKLYSPPPITGLKLNGEN